MTRRERIRILVADSDSFARDCIKRLCKNDKHVEIIGETEDAESTLKLTLELAPDVLLMDVSNPEFKGAEVFKKVKSAIPSVILLALTATDNLSIIVDAIKAGASGYLLKSDSASRLISAIKAVYSGSAVASPRVANLLSRNTLQAYAPSDMRQEGKKDQLTQQELKILSYAAKGLSNKEIALELGLSPFTVKSHFASILSKTGARTRGQAILTVWQQRLASSSSLSK